MTATAKRHAMYERIQRHGQNLLAIFPNATERDPVKLCKRLRQIEAKAKRANVRLCSDPEYTRGAFDAAHAIARGKTIALLGGFGDVSMFVNGDPRGYALKIDDGWMRENRPALHTDWGGYGIIAPDLTDGERVPADFPVQPLRQGQAARDKATCGTCGRSWDDSIPTTYTPAPSARCPFEAFHDEKPEAPAGKTYPCPDCGADNAFVNQCGCDPENMPTRVQGHTPGPWIVCCPNDNPAILSIEQDREALTDEEPSIIAEVDLAGDGISPEIGNANAALIAAAPALLAACEGLEAYAGELGPCDGQLLAIITAARAAIADARP